MRDEISGHPNSVVGDDKFILPLALCKSRNFTDPETHTASLRGIFYGIGEQVHQNLLQAVLICYHFFMPHMVSVNLQLQVFFRGQGPEYIHNVLNQLWQRNVLRNKIDFPAFDSGHIQYLIDKV